MLVLTRLVGETICIGDDIKVTVRGIRAGGKVRLSIEAPDDVVVDRLEVFNRKLQEKRASSRLKTK